jgi:hypothetical protein
LPGAFVPAWLPQGLTHCLLTCVPWLARPGLRQGGLRNRGLMPTAFAFLLYGTAPASIWHHWLSPAGKPVAVCEFVILLPCLGLSAAVPVSAIDGTSSAGDGISVRKVPSNTWASSELGRTILDDTQKATYTKWLMLGFGLAWIVVWCRWPDSNRHGLRHCPLKTACLPIPPHRHGVLASDAVIQIEHRGLLKAISL